MNAAKDMKARHPALFWLADWPKTIAYTVLLAFAGFCAGIILLAQWLPTRWF